MPTIPKASFEETLGRKVLPSVCIGCGSCVVVCPTNCLEYVDGKPVLTKECKSCGICAQICPTYEPSMPAMDQFVFGRARREDEDFGVFRQIVIAQTKDEAIRKVCQDGGIVTTLLAYALDSGLIDGAVLSGVSETEPLKAVPRLALTRGEIAQCAGTRYTYSPNMLAVKEGILQRRKNLAFVGTPCQIHAVRKIQALPLKKYSQSLGFTIGLLCSECFTYNGLVKELIKGHLGIDPWEVVKVNIKGRLIITSKSGNSLAVPLKEVKRYSSNCLSDCPDFSAELADISVGGLGLDGWTFTILRTEKGEKLFNRAESEGMIRTRPIHEEKKAFDLLVTLSRKKHQSATDLVH